MQRQINYGTCIVQYDNNGNYNRSVSDVIIKMSLKTDKHFVHFMKLIIIIMFIKYILKHKLTTTTIMRFMYSIEILHYNLVKCINYHTTKK